MNIYTKFGVFVVVVSVIGSVTLVIKGWHKDEVVGIQSPKQTQEKKIEEQTKNSENRLQTLLGSQDKNNNASESQDQKGRATTETSPKTSINSGTPDSKAPVGSFTLPSAPTGFSWQALVEVNGWILKPQSWFFSHEMKSGTQAYFISKEQIVDSDGIFQTGITINVIPKSGVPGGDADSYAKQYVSNFIQRGAKLKSEKQQVGSFVIYRLDQRLQDNEGDTSLYAQVMVNTKKGTLYILMFETPTSNVQSITPIAKVILERFIFDDDI